MTKPDSDKRQKFPSGMERELCVHKPRFDLLYFDNMPYEKQPIYRWANHMAKGAAKYSDKNYLKANSQGELERFRQSAARHFTQWMCGETDEDHMAACVFNLFGAEYVKWRLESEVPYA